MYRAVDGVEYGLLCLSGLEGPLALLTVFNGYDPSAKAPAGLRAAERSSSWLTKLRRHLVMYGLIQYKAIHNNSTDTSPTVVAINATCWLTLIWRND